MLGERNRSQHSVDDGGTRDRVGRGASGSTSQATAATMTSAPVEPVLGAPQTIDNGYDTPKVGQATSATPRSFTGRRLWLFAALSALLLTGLTVAGIYLVTKKASTVDQLVILTVPSGADISLDSKEYGHSPVKLERLAFGTYTLTISKEGYEPIVRNLPVTESGLFEYKLTPIPPPEAAGLTAEEQIRQYQQRAEETFARGFFGIPYEGSALYYADSVGNVDSKSTFPDEMRERIRKAAHQSAQNSISRGDLGRAQEVYNFLVEHYPTDEEARTAAAKLENQLSRAMGQVRELVRKADEAFQSGLLIEPTGKSAYFYSKQALAIDRQNEKARQIRNQVREALVAAGEQANKRGEGETAIKQLEEVGQLFPEDKEARARVREIKANLREAEAAKAAEPSKRNRGLAAYASGDFAAAIPDLQHAVATGQSGAAVVFALARSYLMTGHLDQAEPLFHEVRPTDGEDVYHSSIAGLGEIAYKRGDTATAVERWKRARQLGGSILYSVASLDDKIEQIEKKEREKAAEPSPLTLQVKHLHGGLLGGSCSGTLTINATGVRFEGQQHVYASNLVGAGVSLTKDDMVITFQGNSQKFRVARGDGERVRQTIAKYQQTYSPASK